MRIRLINGYGVEVDTCNYILVKERSAKDKNGNPKGMVEEQISYHGTMEQLLLSFLNRVMREKVMNREVNSLKDFYDNLQSLKKEIDDVIATPQFCLKDE